MVAILRAVIIGDGFFHMVRVFAQAMDDGYSHLPGRFGRKLADFEVAAESFQGDSEGGCAGARDHGIDLPVAWFAAVIDTGGTFVDG